MECLFRQPKYEICVESTLWISFNVNSNVDRQTHAHFHIYSSIHITRLHLFGFISAADREYGMKMEMEMYKQ